MNIKLIYIYSILMFSIDASSKPIENLVWNKYSNQILGLSLSYPSFFQVKYPYKKDSTKIYLSYKRYESVDDSGKILLEIYSSAIIYKSKSDFQTILKDNNFIQERDEYYSKDRTDITPIDTISYNKWIGLKGIGQVAIYTKNRGPWTLAADEDVYILVKNIKDNESIVFFARGFNFKNGMDVLKKICLSIEPISD